MKFREYKQEFVKHFLEWTSAGVSPKVCAKRFGVRFKLLEQWSQDTKKTDFGRAYRLGLEAWEAWWDDHLKRVASGEAKGNVAAIQFYMKNNFKKNYNDDTHSTTDYNLNINMSREEIDRGIEFFAKNRKLIDITPDVKTIN